jgi:chromosome segregation ATPase
VAAEIASAEAELAGATKIRGKENADFKTFEKDISETIDTLERAIGLIEKEYNKMDAANAKLGGASMMQFSKAGNVVKALSAMVAAEAISSADGKKLTAFVQSQSDSDDDDMGAPTSAVYETSEQQPPILDALNGLLEKANSELEGAREAEKSSLHGYEMVRQSLNDQIKFSNKEFGQAKTTKAEAEETKGTAEGDVAVTTADLNEDTKTLAGIHHDCMSKASEYETEVKSRGEELKALAEAKKIIVEATSLAQTSFMQLSSVSGLPGLEAVKKVRAAAKRLHAPELAQLASRMDSTVRFGNTKDEIFASIIKMTEEKIAKIQAEDAADLTEKAFCDEEVPEAKANVDDKADEIEKLTAKIDKMIAKSKILKGEVAGIEAELVELVKAQAGMDKIRQEEKANFEEAKPVLEKAIAGIQKALKVLNDYYSNGQGSSGASSGIIGLLEVAESDFSKELAEITDAEDKSAYFYNQETKENDITKLQKEADVKYKTKEATDLDKSVSEYTSDRAGVMNEQAAVTDQYNQLKSRCTVMPPNYEERQSKREEEIAELKDALESLEALSGNSTEPVAEGAPVAEAAPAEEAAPAAEAAPAEAPAAEEAPAFIQKYFLSVHRH